MHLSLVLGLLYLASEILLALLRRTRESGGATAQDRNSLRILWVVILLSIWLGINFGPRFQGANLPHRREFELLGAAIFCLGIILRWWSILALGRFFTVNVAIARDHQLVEAGPYRFVRHPSYTGALLAFAGFGLSLGNWASLLLVVVPIFIAFVYRMRVEESALCDGLGESYRSYMQRTKRLAPFLY